VTHDSIDTEYEEGDGVGVEERLSFETSTVFLVSRELGKKRDDGDG
jgi:hypothetical protein